MSDFSLALADEPLNGPCGLCGEVALWNRGLRLMRIETATPVCRHCAKTEAPHHLALLELASVADRVGRHSRHLLTPAMNSLLELARAAESYANAG